MGYKSSREEIELYKRVDEVLHYLWDPIGVAEEPWARDEYYSYLPKMNRMASACGLQTDRTYKDNHGRVRTDLD